jgi:hypothetical protein
VERNFAELLLVVLLDVPASDDGGGVVGDRGDD